MRQVSVGPLMRYVPRRLTGKVVLRTGSFHQERMPGVRHGSAFPEGGGVLQTGNACLAAAGASP